MPNNLRIENLSFAYPDAVETLFEGVTLTCGRGWTAVAGANGAGKSTLVKLLIGELPPTGGVVTTPGGLYCPQETDTPPADLEEFMNDWDAPTIDLKEMLGIEYEWFYRWDSLSHGERKRLQMAVALWRAPAVLAVDEPTNHLDANARRDIGNALAQYDGTGLLVSHDRALLDRLCRTTIVVDGGGVTVRPGAVTQAAAQESRDLLTAERRKRDAANERDRVTKEFNRRAERARSVSGGYSKGKLDRNDHAGRFDVDLARVTGKDRRAGDLKRQLERRLRRVEEAHDEARGPEAPRPVLTAAADIQLPGARSPRDLLLRVPAGEVSLGPVRRLTYPDLELHPGDRVHVTGANGVGKTTLIRDVLGGEIARLRATSGVVVLPQELTPKRRSELRRAVGDLTRDELGRVLAIVHSLGSDPTRIRQTTSWSPGEERKVLLALGALSSPVLYVLDEPTNHLDLPSILAVERALTRQEAAVILISHDQRFAGALTNQTWDIRHGSDGTRTLQTSQSIE